MRSIKHLLSTLLLLALAVCLCGSARAGTFPLRASATKTYLVDSNGAPFFLHTVGTWCAINALTNEWEWFCESRATQKVTGVMSVAPMFGYQSYSLHSVSSPENCYGETPFPDTADIGTVNTNYFDRLKHYFKIAEDSGMNVLWYCAYLANTTDHGFSGFLLDNSLASCTNYGRFLGNHFKDVPNFIYVLAGDANPASYSNRLDAIARGIKEYDTNHLLTVDPESNNTGYGRFKTDWMTANYVYDFGLDTIPSWLYKSAAATNLPIIISDGPYENDSNADYTARSGRSLCWWGMTYGAGSVFSTGETWQMQLFTNDIYTALATNLMHFVRWVENHTNWYRLEPDLTGFIADTNRGSGNTTITVANYTNQWAVSYFADGSSLTFYTTNMASNTFHAWWYNPRTGQSNDHGTFGNTTNLSVTPADANDWVFVLGDVPLDADEPPAASTNYYRAYMSGKIEMSGKAVLQ